MTDEYLYGYERAGSPGLLRRLAEIEDRFGRFIVVCRQDREANAPRVGIPGPFEEGRLWTPFVTVVVPAEERAPDLQKVIDLWRKVPGRGWSADPTIPNEIRSIEDPLALDAALEGYLTATDTVRTNAYLTPDKDAFILTSWAIESLAVPVPQTRVANLRGGRTYQIVISCGKGNLGDVEVCSASGYSY